MKMLLMVVLMSSLFTIVSCVSSEDEGQDWGNIFDGVEGLILTEEEHPDGWGREDCFACHPLEVIHQEDRSGLGVLLLEDIREFTEQEGLASCPICHGDNGVPELTE
ncbi:MAG: hypothetical protein A3J42_04530 [Candidatus Dadabacteria bacterium RIFCSPHIGHO2_12_FULL_53_21]|jgi:hypothetical protein|nr:MAG: hypothetical protein A3J42_04530 [Candidatus Dadabacteria bacterium RIFCSPHIGHO2_12_FULL_53_21]